MNAPVRKGELLTAEEVIDRFYAPAATDMITALVARSMGAAMNYYDHHFGHSFMGIRKIVLK